MSSNSNKSSPNSPSDVSLEALETLLQNINVKLSKAEVLNGGFDRMQTHLEGLKQDVGEIRTEVYKVNVDLRSISMQNTEFKEDLGKVNEAIYHPDNGIYTRIQKTSSSQESRDKKMDTAIQKIENVEKIIIPLQRTDQDLINIAGKDLQELQNIVKTRAILNRMFWIMLAVIITGAGKSIWELVSSHIK